MGETVRDDVFIPSWEGWPAGPVLSRVEGPGWVPQAAKHHHIRHPFHSHTLRLAHPPKPDELPAN